MSEKPSGHEHTKRDAESLIALGTFLVLLALPVFAGIFFEEENFAQLVNFFAGTAILTIGGLMLWRGIWTRRHLG